MNRLFLYLILFCLLPACTSMNTNENAKGLLETLEFGEDEVGCFRLSGTIDLNPLPLINSNVSMLLIKQKGTDIPGC